MTQQEEADRLKDMLAGRVPKEECLAYVATKLNQPHPDDPTWRGIDELLRRAERLALVRVDACALGFDRSNEFPKEWW